MIGGLIPMILVVVAGFTGYELYQQKHKPDCIDVGLELIAVERLDKALAVYGSPLNDGYSNKLRKTLTTPGACRLPVAK